MDERLARYPLLDALRDERFPAYSAPFRTVLAHQATHVDVDFYDRFYHPDALSETQRQHTDRWHDPEAQT